MVKLILYKRGMNMEWIKKLNSIFIKHLGIDYLKNVDLQCEHFFSNKLNVPGRELVLIMLDIENEFEFSFSEDFLREGKFESFNSICDYIKLYLNKERRDILC